MNHNIGKYEERNSARLFLSGIEPVLRIFISKKDPPAVGYYIESEEERKFVEGHTKPYRDLILVGLYNLYGIRHIPGDFSIDLDRECKIEVGEKIPEDAKIIGVDLIDRYDKKEEIILNQIEKGVNLLYVSLLPPRAEPKEMLERCRTERANAFAEAIIPYAKNFFGEGRKKGGYVVGFQPLGGNFGKVISKKLTKEGIDVTPIGREDVSIYKDQIKKKGKILVVGDITTEMCGREMKEKRMEAEKAGVEIRLAVEYDRVGIADWSFEEYPTVKDRGNSFLHSLKIFHR
jgi:hypothetical protein